MATIQASRGAPVTQDFGASHPYTCNTCQVAFRNSDLQKGHMRSDWHRYNLKRRVASLPPISSETFTDKVLQARASATAEADRAGFHRECDVCQRTYYSENSYHNHLESQKHRAREVAIASGRNGRSSAIDDASSVMSSTFSLGDPVPDTKTEPDSEAEDEFNNIVNGLKKTDLKDSSSPIKRPSNPSLSEAGDSTRSAAQAARTGSNGTTPAASVINDSRPELTLKSCIFCNYDSPTPQLSVIHMERIHGMFIPERQYLVDLEGLLGALQQRVQDYHECLYCGKAKVNAYAVQTHMRDKGHCKIPYTTEDEQLEIGDFYDFRSTYSDPEGSDDEEDSAEDEDKTRSGAKLGSKKQSKTVDSDGEEVDEDGEGWETDSSASSLDSADLTAVPMEGHHHQYERLSNHPHHSRAESRPHHQRDGWHSHSQSHKPTHAAFYDEYELHLSNGKSVGHRSHMKYFRQNLTTYPTSEEREAQQLAIENGEGTEADGAETGTTLARRGNGERDRAVIRQSEAGMVGVSDAKKKEVRRAEQKGRAQQQAAQRRDQAFVNKKANNQKHFRDPLLQ